MNNKGTKCYVDKLNEIYRKSNSLEGCKNRMCTTDNADELLRLYSFLTLYSADLYRLNCERLIIAKYGNERPCSAELLSLINMQD